MGKTGEWPFSGSRLRLARTFAGLTQADLGERVAVSHQFIGYLETGIKQPVDMLIEALGDACGFRPSFFSGPDLHEFRDEECHFRRRQTTPISVRTRVLAHGTLFGQLVDFLDENLSLPRMQIPERRVTCREEIERSAERCRSEWRPNSAAPVKSMTRVLENAGVVVTRFEGAAEKIDAFSRPGHRSIVVLNTDKDSPSRSRFDMAHECGHLVMHGGLETGQAELEKEADCFASALLLPRAGFVREFPRSPRPDWDGLFRLKARWGVSIAAIVRRAYDLRLMDAMSYQRAYKYISNQGWRKGEPGEPEPEIPEMIPLAFKALDEQGITFGALAEAFGWSFETMSRVTGLTGPEPTDTNPQETNVIHLPLRRLQQMKRR